MIALFSIFKEVEYYGWCPKQEICLLLPAISISQRWLLEDLRCLQVHI